MEIDKYLSKALEGDYEMLLRLIMILSEYVPNGIDNMVFLYKDDTKSLYLSSEGVKAVMVARGEFLPFIESHIANVSLNRLKESEWNVIRERLPEIFRELYHILTKWLDYSNEEDPHHDKALEYINWYRENYGNYFSQ